MTLEQYIGTGIDSPDLLSFASIDTLLQIDGDIDEMKMNRDLFHHNAL